VPHVTALRSGHRLTSYGGPRLTARGTGSCDALADEGFKIARQPAITSRPTPWAPSSVVVSTVSRVSSPIRRTRLIVFFDAIDAKPPVGELPNTQQDLRDEANSREGSSRAHIYNFQSDEGEIEQACSAQMNVYRRPDSSVSRRRTLAQFVNDPDGRSNCGYRPLFG
jgi:hypothetical protein